MTSSGGPWWQQAVFYEIYIRSFQDSDDDGVGDLNGITARLPYLQDLGVDALWITPFYPSPQVDFGYDIADHENVDPAFGTLADFDRLVREAHRRGLKVVIDVVLNHTSDQHPFFLESRGSRDAARRDWYIWRDGAGDGGPPTNWESAFGGPAWTFDPRTGQWYYHFFYAEQPDLNWRNPAVEARMLETLAFWLGHGVDGFRLDAVNTLFEDADLRPNPPLPVPQVTLTGVYTQAFVHNRRLPEVHDVLRRIRRFVESRHPDAVLISEAYLDDVADLARFYGDGDEMHLPFNFFLAQVPSRDAAAFRHAIEAVEEACAPHWPSLVLSNHDIARACDRYASPEHADALARLLALLLLTLRGTPFLYYGEEIGMRTDDPHRLEDVRDPVGRRFWPLYKGRDGARRPMQWDTTAGGGFSRGTPWLALARDAGERTVQTQAAEAGSLLQFYQQLLRARRERPGLRSGRYQTVDAPGSVIAWRRESTAESLLIVLNLGEHRCDASVTEASHDDWAVVLGTHRPAAAPIRPRQLALAPFEGVLLVRR